MKIAIVSDDGKTVSNHFGKAPLFVVATITDEKVINREERAKTGHHTFAGHHAPKLSPDERHGCDADSQVRHRSMTETIADCQVLIAGGMGWGAYESLKRCNINPVVTDVENIEDAVKLFLQGKLLNLTERLH